MSFAIRSIVHPADFSYLSSAAFAHALRIAVSAKCRLHALHVAEAEGGGDATGFPQVRRLLVQWGLLEEGDSPTSRLLGTQLETEYGSLYAPAVFSEFPPWRQVRGDCLRHQCHQ